MFVDPLDAPDPLVQYLESRSQSHFDRLVEETSRQVINAAFRVLGDKGLAQDVAQDLYLKLLRGKLKPEAKHEALRSGVAYLLHTARLLAQAKLRSERRLARALERKPCKFVTQDGHRFTQEDFWDMEDAVQHLPDTLRTYVEMRLEGLSAKDIAKALKRGESTVYGGLKMARALLRVRLEGPGAALILPFLWEKANASLPSIPVSGEVAERLKQLSRRGSLRGSPKAPRFKRTTRRASYTGLLLSVAASVAIVGFILFLGAFPLAGRGGGKKSGLLAESNRQRARSLPLPPPAVVDLRDRKESLGEAKGPDSAEEPPKEEAAPVEEGKTSAVIRVVDEHGNLLRQGTLNVGLLPELDVKKEASLGGIARIDLRRGAVITLRSLSEENPAVVDEIPKVFCRHEFKASVILGGLKQGESKTFRVEAGKTTEVEILVPTASEKKLALTVMDAATGEPDCWGGD